MRCCIVASTGISAVEDAASRAETVNRARDDIRSARFNRADPKAPTTKPICTDRVSQARAGSLKDQADVSAGTTAEAENQTAMARSSARQSRSSVGHLRCSVKGNAPTDSSVAMRLFLQW